MEATRGIRGADSRSLRGRTPNPAYVVEWEGALQVDLISGGVLNVKKEVLKTVPGLKKSYLKFYCTFANLLASQRDYMIAVYKYKYMLTLGVMEKGDFICVNRISTAATRASTQKPSCMHTG